MGSLEIPEVAEVATKPIGDLLELISSDDSAEGEARDELARRIKVIFNKDSALGSCSFRFENFMRHATANIFTVEVFVDDPRRSDHAFLQWALGNLYSVNSVVLTEGDGYRVSFDIEKFERKLIQCEELAGLHVDEPPLTIDQITKPRLHWANLQFNEVVQPEIHYSTAFKSIEEVDGGFRILADTVEKEGDKKLSAYVSVYNPFDFYLRYGEVPPGCGVYLYISFENFEKLLPSTGTSI